MVILAVIIPVLMLGVVLALGRYEELLLPDDQDRGKPGPAAGARLARRKTEQRCPARGSRVDRRASAVRRGWLILTVTDDGRGVPEGAARSGLKNMEERAVALGSDLRLGERPEGRGARLVWRGAARSAHGGRRAPHAP